MQVGGGCSPAATLPAQDAGPEAFAPPKKAPDAGRDALADWGAWDPPLEGWDLYGDYDPWCGFYVPQSREKLPPPIRWEPCRVTAVTSALNCRSMVHDWVPQISGEWTTAGTKAFILADGTVTLMAARFHGGPKPRIERLIADADGPVRVAVIETNTRGCTLGEAESNGGQYAWHVFDSEAKGELSDYGGGALGGPIGELRPKTLFHRHDAVPRSYIAGIPGIVELGGGRMDLYDWNTLSFLGALRSVPQDNGLLQNWQFFHSEALFWASDSDAYNKQKVWTAAGGTKDFITFGSDWSKGAADLGTDGVDLVWIVGSDRTKSYGVFPKESVVTAPYTTDPAQLQPRTLRNDFTGHPFGTSPFVVGCGYAARRAVALDDAGYQNTIAIVRIADGALWRIPVEGDVTLGTPIAINCTEVFTTMNERVAPGVGQVHNNIARIRLDSLGVPLAP